MDEEQQSEEEENYIEEDDHDYQENDETTQDEDEDEDEDEDGGLIAKANKYMDIVTCCPDNPNPNALHALASLLQLEHSRYMEAAEHSSSDQNRASFSVGRLGNLIRENDEFFEMISSKFLSESRYSISIQAAAARVLLSCSLSWKYPHVFEDDVTENIKNWVLDDSAIYSSDDIWKCQFGKKECTDFDMRKTYSIGLLALCLISGSQVVDDVLTSGLSAKLMHYLRNRVLCDTSSRQKVSSHLAESKSVSLGGARGRDEGRVRLRPPLENASRGDSRMLDDGCSGDLGVHRDLNRTFTWKAHGEEQWMNGEPPNRSDEDIYFYDADIDGDTRWHGRDMQDGRLKTGERDVAVSHRMNHGWMRYGEKTSVGLACSPTERSLPRNMDGKQVVDNKRTSNRSSAESTAMEREDTDECIQECRVGSKDISDLVTAAVRAAEAEARDANAPIEAVRAAGEAAAELVKSAAMDEFKNTNNEEAAILAASRAMSTVIDAAKAIEVSRNADSVAVDLPKNVASKPERDGDFEFFLPDSDALAQLREKSCIQCLAFLGEYVEALGPVLHEKGVDVCLALLCRYSEEKKESQIVSFLPDVLKLICALAAHRKFAAVFVDRGGIQKLLAVPRVLHTFFGLSSCLFAIGSLQGVMECVCALPTDVIHKLVGLGLQLLVCPQDQARKNAALFFAAAFVFRAVVDAFDAQDGLQKSLGLLHDAASVRSGVNSGTLGASAPGLLRIDRSNGEVLTTSEKQIAYHTCVALRQYFRAQLLLLVETVRPNKSNRSTTRQVPVLRAGYKPLDISNEAMDTVFLHIQKDRKAGPALVRAEWLAVDRFLACNGHVIMLELCQGPPAPVERYLHDLLQYVLGILHIVTLVPKSRKLIANATLSNDRVCIAVILDAATGLGYIDPDIIQQALNVLINLVCPPPSISNKSHLAQNQQSFSIQTSNTSTETRDRNSEKNISDRTVPLPHQSETKERRGEPNTADRGSSMNNTLQSPTPNLASGLVGDRRISLGAGARCAGLAAQLEQIYRQAREAVRSNNGIKVLLQVLQTRVVLPPATLDCLRALACRVLLGLARDDAIAQILTKLQVGKKLSEAIRDLGNQTPGSEQSRWQTELTQAAIELIAIVTNSGRASTLAASDAATPTLRRMERAAIAAATPISYHSRELLMLIHEHLQACGLSLSASTLMKEAELTLLPLSLAPSSIAHHGNVQAVPSIQIQWPVGRAPGGFFNNRLKMLAQNEELHVKCDSSVSLKKKPVIFSSSFNARSKVRSSSIELQTPSISKTHNSSRRVPGRSALPETLLTSTSGMTVDAENHVKFPIVLPMKRKLSELKEVAQSSSAKRLNANEYVLKTLVFQTPSSVHRGSLLSDLSCTSTPNPNFKDLHGWQTSLPGQVDNFDDGQYNETLLASCQPGPSSDVQPANSERLTLDSIVVQYLKHQHRQCSAPITTLPPLSLLQPHVCPEPRRNHDSPFNVTDRLSTREFKSMYGGIHESRKDRQFVYSRFRPWRTCRDDAASLLTCMTFLGESSQIAAGSHSGELKIFDTNSNNILENCTSHENPLILVQSYTSSGSHLVLSSSSLDVKLWEASSISGGPIETFDACRAASFGNTGTYFAALPSEASQRDILLYDLATQKVDQKLSDTSSGAFGRAHAHSTVHFSPSDTLLLWNGVLWDRRVSCPVHRFDKFTDYGGGGFHPAGNEVIINSEVWDLRKFKLLRSVPSLDQTVITFNSSGDVIYAILRRNLDDITSFVHTRRSKHPLFSAFRTFDAVDYSDIATIPVDRCVLDFTTEPTDSFVGLVTMDDQDKMFSSARVYEIGRRRPLDDDSDPDDVESEEDADDDDEDDVDLDPILVTGLGDDDDSDGADMSNHDSVTDIDEDDDDDDDDDGDFLVDDAHHGVNRYQDIATEDEDEDDDDSELMGYFSSADEII